VALPPVHRNWWQSHQVCIPQAEPGNEIDEIMRTFKDLCSFVPKKCINKNVLYSIIYKTTTLVDVCDFQLTRIENVSFEVTSLNFGVD